MKDFNQWMSERVKFDEKTKRTALSANYPSLYHGIRQQPRQAWTPISATAALADKQIGPDEKVEDGGPNTSNKKDNPYGNFYKTEWQNFSAKKLSENTDASKTLWLKFLYYFNNDKTEEAKAILGQLSGQPLDIQTGFFNHAQQQFGPKAALKFRSIAQSSPNTNMQTNRQGDIPQPAQNYNEPYRAESKKLSFNENEQLLQQIQQAINNRTEDDMLSRVSSMSPQAQVYFFDLVSKNFGREKEQAYRQKAYQTPEMGNTNRQGDVAQPVTGNPFSNNQQTQEHVVREITALLQECQ